MTKHSTEETNKQMIEEHFTLENATPFAGANLLWDYAELAVGLKLLFAKHFGFGKAKNAIYPLYKTNGRRIT